MTGPGFDVDPGGMAAVAARMTGSTAAFGAAAGGGGGAPVAGTATGDVLAYLQAVTEAAARFAEAAQRSGEAVGQAAAGYVRGDGAAASRIGAAGDTTSAQARIGAQALDDFATSVQGVLDTMARARGEAAAAGLPVSGEVIGDPVAVAPAQRAAFDRARQVTDEARTRYVEAQTELTDRIRAPTSEAVAVARNVLLVVSSVTSTLGALHGAAQSWADLAERAATERAAFVTALLAPEVPVEQAARGALQAGDELDVAQRAGGANAGALRAATLGASETALGQRALDALRWTPAELVGTGPLARAAPVLRRVPGVSIGFAVAGGVADVEGGRGVGSAVAKQGATLAAGAGASWVVTAAGTAAAGAIGAGAVAALPVTLVAVGVGALVAYGVGANWDSIESTAEDLLP